MTRAKNCKNCRMYIKVIGSQTWDIFWDSVAFHVILLLQWLTKAHFTVNIVSLLWRLLLIILLYFYNNGHSQLGMLYILLAGFCAAVCWIQEVSQRSWLSAIVTCDTRFSGLQRLNINFSGKFFVHCSFKIYAILLVFSERYVLD